MYSGSSLESNAENVVSKAMLNMKMQRTDVEKGLMLGNILRNNKPINTGIKPDNAVVA